MSSCINVIKSIFINTQIGLVRKYDANIGVAIQYTAINTVVSSICDSNCRRAESPRSIENVMNWICDLNTVDLGPSWNTKWSILLPNKLYNVICVRGEFNGTLQRSQWFLSCLGTSSQFHIRFTDNIDVGTGKASLYGRLPEADVNQVCDLLHLKQH